MNISFSAPIIGRVEVVVLVVARLAASPQPRPLESLEPLPELAVLGLQLLDLSGAIVRHDAPPLW
jgi:hypothetical protein